MKTEMIEYLLVVIASIIGAFAPMMLKKGVRDIRISVWALIFNWKIISGIFFYLLSSFFFVFALKRGELNILYPLVSLSYVWVIMISKFTLKEKINKWKIFGIISIILGITLVGIA